MIGILPQWFQIFFLSMIPWLESRYVIPFAISSFGWDWWQAFPIAVAGNMLPVPFILLFFKFVEKFLRNYKFWTRIMDWLFSRTRKRADSKIRKYEYLGLILFVAIPLPFTGAWTGSLIAYLFDLKFSKSLLTIFIGVIIAASVMTFLFLTGQYIWFSFNG
ncbi:MAG: small multi-drug export protein [Thermoplasmatales archaeon]|nr:small multi-drug export protein [Thermoplasmatales archaeon]